MDYEVQMRDRCEMIAADRFEFDDKTGAVRFLDAKNEVVALCLGVFMVRKLGD